MWKTIRLSVARKLDKLRDCVHTDVGLIFCLQNLSYELPILSFISFGLESTFLHGFSHKILLELSPLRLQLHLKHNPNKFATLLGHAMIPFFQKHTLVSVSNDLWMQELVFFFPSVFLFLVCLWQSLHYFLSVPWAVYFSNVFRCAEVVIASI